jgi:hypothetical protein
MTRESFLYINTVLSYCYHAFNVITYGLAQSDHIIQHLLQINTKIKSKEQSAQKASDHKIILFLFKECGFFEKSKLNIIIVF